MVAFAKLFLKAFQKQKTKGKRMFLKDKNLYYFKPNQNMEIDFIIESDNQIIPIEIK